MVSHANRIMIRLAKEFTGSVIKETHRKTIVARQ